MPEFLFLRHGMTSGNEKKRYIGVTDEPLCRKGLDFLQSRRYPAVQRVFVSPLLRCRETAAVLYPHHCPEIIEEFRECHFGEFENKNYLELADNPRYQQWIDSGGTLPFPGGESREQFAARTLIGMIRVAETCLRDGTSSAAVIVHGGTIMSILEAWGVPSGDYYSWHTANGCGYLTELEEKNWRQSRPQLHILRKIDFRA